MKIDPVPKVQDQRKSRTTAGRKPRPWSQILDNKKTPLKLRIQASLGVPWAPKIQNMFPKSMIQITAGVNPDPGPQILENPRAESLDLRRGSYRPKSTNLGGWTPSGRALDPQNL